MSRGKITYAECLTVQRSFLCQKKDLNNNRLWFRREMVLLIYVLTEAFKEEVELELGIENKTTTGIRFSLFG